MPNAMDRNQVREMEQIVVSLEEDNRFVLQLFYLLAVRGRK
jgi:hypothetical protein